MKGSDSAAGAQGLRPGTGATSKRIGPERAELSLARELVEAAAVWASVRATRGLRHADAVRLGATLGGLYGAAARRLGTRDHRTATRNLELAFPLAGKSERQAILNAMWRNWGRTLMETSRIASLGRDELRDLVRLDPPDGPREVFTRARESGALVLTAHLGSFELLHAACAAHGFPITVVHKTLANGRVDRWLTELRRSAGTRLLRKGSAARQILRALRCGDVVAVPFDQRPRDRSRFFVPFFSLPAATNSGLARLAIASQAPVFPVVLVREDESERHRAVFLPAVAMVRTGDREHDALENTRRFNLALEGLVRRFPEQWSWMYNRWKEYLKGRVPGTPPRLAGSAAPDHHRVTRGSADDDLHGVAFSADRTP